MESTYKCNVCMIDIDNETSHRYNGCCSSYCESIKSNQALDSSDTPEEKEEDVAESDVELTSDEEIISLIEDDLTADILGDEDLD